VNHIFAHSYMIVSDSKSYSAFNLDYEGLNRRLVCVKRQVGMKRAQSSQSLFGETRTFAEILDQEVEKVVLFYIREQGCIAGKAWELRSVQLSYLQDFRVPMQKIDELLQSYRNLGLEVVHLLNYLDGNVASLREIIKKHDTCFDQKMGSVYFDTRIGKSSATAHLLPLYHQEGIQAILSTIRKGFEDLHDARAALIQGEGIPIDYNRLSNNTSSRSTWTRPRSNSKELRANIPRIPFGKRLASLGNFQAMFSGNTAAGAAPMAADANAGGRPKSFSSANLLGMLRTFSDPPAVAQLQRSTSDLEPILKHIHEIADRVMRSQKQSTLHFIANTSALALEVNLDDQNSSSEDESLGAGGMGESQSSRKFAHAAAAARRFLSSHSGLYLNLFLTFVYLANQYVVAPTSAQYARLLGMTPALSGVIIGLCPAAAMVSALLYSMWSNYSFKQPILFCIACGIVGNLLYGMALQCGSCEMIILGRLITGFGGPRVISRRYIADHVPHAERLLASSQFVTAGALGLSCGPLISSLVERAGYSFTWTWTGEGVAFSPPEYASDASDASFVLVQYQSVTAPGWIFAAIWLVALVAVAIFFQEPEAKV
jgi:hypothetical protein